MFAETNRILIRKTGQAGFIIQSDIATADSYKQFFADLLNNQQLISFYDFVNTEGIFPAVHRTHPHSFKGRDGWSLLGHDVNARKPLIQVRIIVAVIFTFLPPP